MKQVSQEERKEWAKRLVVAFDFEDDLKRGPHWMKLQALILGDKLKGTGVIPKLQSSLRRHEYEFIDEIREFGFDSVFLDPKLYGTSKTLALDGAALRRFKPDIVTVACVSGSDAIRALKQKLPETEVIGVTVPTSFDDAACQEVFGGNIEETVLRLAEIGVKAGLDSFVCAPTEVEMLKMRFGPGISFNTPDIRPRWASVPKAKDRQNRRRSGTPAQAIRAGAKRVIMGDPILLAVRVGDAVNHTIDEMANADVVEA